MEYKVGDSFERKDMQVKIVAKVKHEKNEGYVYLFAHRRFNDDNVEYGDAKDGYFSGWKDSYWLG
jgi:hypothetical protein